MAIAFVVYRVSDNKMVSFFDHESLKRAKRFAKLLSVEQGEEYRVGDEKWAKKTLRIK